MGRLGPLQGALRRAAPKANAKLPLTGDLVRSSIDASLRRLATDRIEVYALHGPSPQEMRDEGVLRALEDVMAAGKTRAVAVAGDAAAAADALGLGARFGVVQLPTPAPGAQDDVLPSARDLGIGAITHSIMGETLAGLVRRATDDAAFKARACEAAGLDDPEAALARLLMSRAFARNSDGVVLVSMLSPRSLERNLQSAAAPPADHFAALGL
jgi:aryl-alcohol dehydrogenase-like predicted oxidoreductase